MLLTQALSQTATQAKSRAAMSYLGKEIPYSDFKVRIAKLSYLYQHEIGHGQRVAFYASNCPAYAFALFAMVNTRHTIIPVDPDLTPEEAADWIKESKATHIAVTGDLLEKVRDVMKAGHIMLPLIEIERKQGGEYDTSFSPMPEHVPTPKDPILLFRSAGTASGKPRFATFNHTQLLQTVSVLKSVYHPMGNDRYLTPLRWAHPYAFIHGLLLPLLTGGVCVIDHGMEEKDFLKFIADSKVTRLIATPPWCLKILRLVKEYKRMLPGVKSITVGLGVLSNELAHVFEMMKIQVAHCYGQIESGWSFAMEDTAPSQREADSGPQARGLLGMKYKVLDRAGDEIPGRDEREGLLAVSGGCLMGGYYGLEKETKNALRGTWLYTGDYAKLDGDGEELRITLIGRREEVLVREEGIVNVRPIDLALRSLPGLVDGAGFLLKNMQGKTITACAVVKVEKNPLNEKTVLEHVTGKVDASIAPVVVVFTDVIPRDAGGNVNRIRLGLQFSGAAG